jgi:hypothetical protein
MASQASRKTPILPEWEGHEFTRAVEPLKIHCALAPEVGSLHPPQFFPWPVQPRRFEV